MDRASVNSALSFLVCKHVGYVLTYYISERKFPHYAKQRREWNLSKAAPYRFGLAGGNRIWLELNSIIQHNHVLVENFTDPTNSGGKTEQHVRYFVSAANHLTCECACFLRNPTYFHTLGNYYKWNHCQLFADVTLSVLGWTSCFFIEWCAKKKQVRGFCWFH